MTSPTEHITTKLAQLPISDDAVMCRLLRTTLLAHADQGRDITEPTLLGLLAITGALKERLTRLEATLHPHTMTPPHINPTKTRAQITRYDSRNCRRPRAASSPLSSSSGAQPEKEPLCRKDKVSGLFELDILFVA